ncbi:MAG TPA: cytochrome d ubiquinol oxidase subunit II [Chitinophagaceae bacterium]|nr:cytochrome d ubiquinol oxidase subunit II [Chitinophagaceae bacterium]
MLSVIIIILAISFVLYALLGGADFGAGIVETFAGRRGEKTISKAIAPVWEANHVWLILAIVILFTGFPRVYAAISTALHIPLMIVLIGIVLRGSSFTFRHYDVTRDETHKYFTIFFQVSSFITPFFLGVTLGAMIRGNISLDASASFYEQFIRPWLNGFCFTMGLFTTSLFAYIAAVFLVGETIEQKKYARLSRLFLFTTIISGMLVFVVAALQGHHLLNAFFRSPISVVALSIVVLLIPLVLRLLNQPVIVVLRAVVGLQVTLIMLGWFAIQFPVLVQERNGNHLTFYNTQAPPATQYQLLVALFVGLLLVLPAFYFLFKVFKKPKDS